MKKQILISLVALLIFSVFAWFLMGRIRGGIVPKEQKGIANEYSGVIAKKWNQRGVIHIMLTKGTELSDAMLSAEMDSVQVGDSVFKPKGENVCTLFKKDGRVITVKFLYLHQ